VATAPGEKTEFLAISGDHDLGKTLTPHVLAIGDFLLRPFTV
jgi:hypothetical protein